MMLQTLELRVTKARNLRKLARLRRGRPPKAGERYPSGKLKAEETPEQILHVATHQPHRIGAEDPRDKRLATPVGRLVFSGRVRSARFSGGTLIRAAELYARDYANLRWALDSRRPYYNATGSGRPDLTEAQRREFEARWGDVTRAVRDCRQRASKALEMAILDQQPEDWEPPFWIEHSLVEGLEALVVHYELASD